MFSAAVITFREVLEIALVVGITLSYLSKTKQFKFKKFVWYCLLLGSVFSVILAMLLDRFFGGLPKGRTEQIYEGVLMFVTASLLTWMILWVHRQKEVVKQIREKVARHVESKFGLGIVFLTTTSVLREGTETVLYLKAINLSTGGNQILGVGIGLVTAAALGYVIFSLAIRLKLSTIFTVTTVLLLLFAAGLVSHGVHEFQEAKLLPIFSFDPLFNTSHILSDTSTIGAMLRSLFGYTSKPTVLELVSYGSYIVFIFFFERLTDRLITKRALA